MRRPAYEVLGVEPNATREQLSEARRRKLFELHPDRHPEDPAAAAAAIRDVEEAFAVLTAPPGLGLQDLVFVAGDAVVEHLRHEVARKVEEVGQLTLGEVARLTLRRLFR